MFHMSYFTAATCGLDIAPGLLEQARRLFQDADAAWIELTDSGYALSILGDTRSIRSSLDEAIEGLDSALLHGHGRGLPDNLGVMPVKSGVWGVDMADLVRRTRAALESL